MPPGRRRFVSIIRGESLSLAALTVSALGHLLLLGSLALIAYLWAGLEHPKVYVVNLVSGIPSLGRSSEPSRTLEAPSLPARPSAAPQASREVTSESHERQGSVKPAEMPPARKPAVATLPRPGEKELPTLSHSPLPERSAAATPPQGRPSGSPMVAANPSISLDAGNFPFTWYIRQMQQKIEERWYSQPPLARPEQAPVVRFEILRNGSIKSPTIEKSSGNSTFDRAAIRAVLEASPFPPLPEGWSYPYLRVHTGFELPKERG